MAILTASESSPTITKNRFRHALSLTFKQFSEISSVHGIKYFHDHDSNLCGKIIWISIVLVMFFFANCMVYIFYMEFSSNPIRMIIDNDHVPLPNLAFPVVTVCPPTVYNYPTVKRIFKNLTLPNNMNLDEAISYLDQLYSVVGKVRVYDIKKLETLQGIVDLNNLTTADFLSLIRWNCSDLMYRCRFQSKIFNCSEFFISLKTHQGWCCSFNSNEFGMKFHRFNALSFGQQGGLSVIFKNTKDDQRRLEQFVSTELELIVHQSNEFPHRTMLSNSIPRDLEVFAAIRPTETICTDDFKALSIKDRQCLLPFEHNMRFFRFYSTDNCEYECNVMSTFEVCGCIPYTMTSSVAKACDFTKLPCLYKTFRYFVSESIDDNETIKTDSKCYCPHSCEGIEYDVHITRAQLQVAVESCDPFYHGIQPNFTVLHVFMMSQVYRRMSRDTLSDILILIGNLGSSYSLFVGMSMISLLEIGYFFTLVLWKNYTRQ